MASFQAVPDENQFQLSFKPSAGADAGYKYRWQRGNPAVRKQADAPTDAGSPINQTVFVHGLTISLCTSIWGRLFGDVEICQLADPPSPKQTGQFIPYGSQQSFFSWAAGSFRGGGATGRKHYDGRNNNAVMISDFPPTATIFHPSRLLNDYLLHQAPQATVAVTHDDDWLDIFRDDGTLQQMQDSLAVHLQISDRFTIEEEHGLVFFKLKSLPMEFDAHASALEIHGGMNVLEEPAVPPSVPSKQDTFPQVPPPAMHHKPSLSSRLGESNMDEWNSARLLTFNLDSQVPCPRTSASTSHLPLSSFPMPIPSTPSRPSVDSPRGVPAPKTFHRIRSSLEQSLRTATRSKKTAQPVVGDFLTISTGVATAVGKGKERAGAAEDAKEKEKSRWNFRRGGRQAVTPSPSPMPPSPADEGTVRFVAPILRQGSTSSPALRLYSQALPSPKSQSAIPASSSSTSDALVSALRDGTRQPSLRPLRRNLSDLPPKSQSAIPASSSSTSDALVSPLRDGTSLQPLQRNLSDLPPTPARERISRHRATQSNPLNVIVSGPTAPTHVASSPHTPIRSTRERPPSPPDTPTPMSGSRGQIRSSSSAAHVPLNLPLTPTTPRGTSSIRPRSPSNRRVVTPLRGLSSASASHLPLSTSPMPIPSTPRRPSVDAPRRVSIISPRRVSIDSPRRVSIDSPRRPSFRDESPSPVRPRTQTPNQQQRSLYASRQLNASTTSLMNPTPSNPEHRELIRAATSMLCKEVVKPPVFMSRTEAGLRDWEEVEARMRALARLEHIWGRSGV
ncbi:hypothetical protein C8J57DRAFT_1170524, partial [Mycena rebaudengoi]